MNSTAMTIFDSTLQAAQPLACRLFESAITRGRVANAYLMIGRGVDDKWLLTRQLAAHFNCEGNARGVHGSCFAANAPENECCLNCRWIKEGEHPQAWLTLAGQGKSGKIPVEKVRELTEELGKTSAYVRIVVVPESDEVSFHRPAANALLKSIEEPPPNCLFFFFADSADDVLATIVSRCQVIPVHQGMPLGYWSAKPADSESNADELLKKLEPLRQNLLRAARQAHSHDNRAGYVHGVSDILELSRRLQELVKELEQYSDEYGAAQQLLDLVVACEIEVLKDAAQENGNCAGYLSRVCDLAEKARRQLNSFVQPKNAIETFCLALNELRLAHSGEISCGKC